MSGKKLFIRISLFLLTIFFLYRCGERAPSIQISDAEFAKYISAYTSGIISKQSSIKVRLSSEIIQQIGKDKELPKEILAFEPPISGDVIWANDYTIEFKPEEYLPSNTNYKGKFHLDKLVQTPKELSNFRFTFQTIKQSMEVSVDKLAPSGKTNMKLQKLIGTVRTADFEDIENIKKTLSFDGLDSKQKIKWRSDAQGKRHTFEIDSIVRKDATYNFGLRWNASAIGVDKKGTAEIDIPALGNFVFISSRVIHQPEQYLELQFSDPLQENQNLAGLIDIQKVSKESFVIEDNTIRVYPSGRISGEKKVSIRSGIKNISNKKLKEEREFLVQFEAIKPAVSLVSKGVILPESGKGITLPFEAVNLKAVDVTVVKIFENQIPQFFQVNDMSGSYELRRVAKPILRKTISLTESDIVDFGRWNRFNLDLNEFVKTEPGAIYRIGIGFRKKHSLYNCGVSEEEDDNDQMKNFGAAEELEDEQEASGWDGIEEYDDYYYYGDGYWENRDNPCHEAYYGKRRTVYQNIISSNLGIIAKKSNNHDVNVIVTNIQTAQPAGGVKVNLLSYQNQIIASTITDSEGMAKFTQAKDAFFIVAELDKQKGYLKIDDGSSLSLSQFDVGGKAVTKGLKGYLYGERGVWRPGDSIFITFILQEDDKALPKEHPIVFELKNPDYQVVKKEIQKKNKSGFYTFKFKTQDDATTGNWSLNANVGGVSFYKKIKIETVKPNRLKIKLDFGKKYLVQDEGINAEMKVNWLHGAVARELKTKIEAVLNPTPTKFKTFGDYVFDDPTKHFYSEYSEVFKGNLDKEGATQVSTNLHAEGRAPGKLKATFITKVFEKSGDFSIDQFSLPFYPYEAFVGIRLPKGDKARGMLLTDKDHDVDLVVVDTEGELVKTPQKIELSFYKIRWKWWWDKSANDVSSFSSSSYVQKLKSETIVTKKGKASWKIDVKYPDWGRYLVRARNLTTGHSTAKVVYIDWPGWAGRQQKGNSEGVSMLTFSSDKTEYKTGEKIKLSIPSSKGAMALISIENGSKVLETHWILTKDQQSEFEFKASQEMAPNIYVNVTLLQPHSQTANDLPIRMYGVIPVSVENPETHLTPEISMPDVLESEKKFKIQVSEKNGKPMTYTLAIVDEGLLDLTRFKTPDPWKEFYAKEALGVKTWDMFDYVIGAYGGELERLLAIGGDADLQGKKGQKANRFKPVVKFYGPFHSDGGKYTHEIQLPPYVGSVRTMVVAGYNKSYGYAEKATPVKKPLMLLGTLPRVLGTGEKVKLPVTVFAMEEDIKNVTVSLLTNEMLKISGKSSKSLKFKETGEKIVDFDLEVLQKTGIGKIEIEASAGSNKAKYEIELDVRNPNPEITDVIGKVLKKGEVWETDFTPLGMQGTNTAMLEVSNIPPLNLEKRLKYLIKYPHGCIEQITSGAFPQLYLTDLIDLDEQQKQDIENNIRSAIKRIVRFQMSNGGFGYWPSSQNTSEWGSNYVGHFLVEADKKGYTVPASVLKKWKKYQKKKAKNWTDDGTHAQLIQAYRLYTLALANTPAKSSMNRLKEKSKLQNDAKWRLAAAYAISGKKKVAEKLIANLSTAVDDYTELDYTFGSGLRDQAMILETLNLMKMDKKAFSLLKEISAQLSSKRWFGTQTTSYALIAVAGYVKEHANADKLMYNYTIFGENGTKNTQKSFAQDHFIVESTEQTNLRLENKSDGIIYARLILTGVPPVGEETAAENDLKISVNYKTIDGNSLSPDQIEQGTDFMAEVSVSNPGAVKNYKQIALSQIFPSGWEILNTRMLHYGTKGVVSKPDYQDIRDDRVLTYFDLKRNQTKTFRVLLNASYLGKYYLPATYAEAMYDATINARTKGKWVEVIQPGE